MVKKPLSKGSIKTSSIKCDKNNPKEKIEKDGQLLFTKSSNKRTEQNRFKIKRKATCKGIDLSICDHKEIQ